MHSLLPPKPLLLADANQSALTAMALDAFRAGHYQYALALIDRSCRTFAPAAEHLRLRAALRHRLGDAAGSYDDLQAAAQMQPPDFQGHFLLMGAAARLGRRDESLAYAERLLTAADAAAYTRRSLRVLSSVCPEGLGWCVLAGETVTVHLYWNGAPSLRIETFWDGERETRDIGRRERGAHVFDHRAVVELPWRPGAARFSAVTSVPLLGGRISAPRSTAEGESTEVVNGQLLAAPVAGGVPRITVVIPVYRDLEATVACLESVVRHSAGRASIVVVDDASPEPELSAYVVRLAETGAITCIRRRQNGGFIAAVESALDIVVDGDIILLNSDTVVPAGWLDVLTAVAHTDERIGTVTPLSNNGELTSFPEPFVVNPLPSDAVLAMLNDAARSVNGNDAIDIPNGIGFCMYIKRRCLDSVGRFGERYLSHGYFEDVAFSLRADRQGFRNVCATGLVVAHRGSASYRQSKRSFVLRNIGEIARRYPSLSARTDWFVARDTLKPARERILKALPDAAWQAQTAVFVSAAAHTPFDRAVDNLCGDDGAGRILFQSPAGHPHVIVVTMTGAFDFSVAADWLNPDDRAFLTRIAGLCGAKKSICLLFAELPPCLLDLIGQLQVPCEIAVLDEKALLDNPSATALLRHAERIHAGCESAAAILRQSAPDAPVATAPLMTINRQPAETPSVTQDAPIAILPLEPGIAAWRDVEALGLELHRRADRRELIVMGTIMNEAPLMRIGNIMSLGEVSAGEVADLLKLYHCGAAFIAGGSHRFYDERLPALAKVRVPVAARSAGILAELVSGSTDLAIEPKATPRDAAAAVVSWCSAVAAPDEPALRNGTDT